MIKHEGLKITILIENCVSSAGLKAEHGLSMLVEKEGQRFLWDCGQTEQLHDNAAKMGISLKNLDAIVLSHGHYDHSGGLMSTVKKNPGIRVYGHPAIFESKYTRSGQDYRYIGMQHNREEYEKAGANFMLSESSQQIGTGIYSGGFIPRTTAFEEVSPSMVKKVGKNYIKDEIVDDTCLFIKHNSQNILLLGCTHSGIINTLNQVSKNWDIDSFLLVAGGMHLVDKDEKYVEDVLTKMKQFNLHQVIPLHCTGIKNLGLFYKHFGSRLGYAGSGSILNFNGGY